MAAVDEDTAEEALALIKVEYEPLPAVFDLERPWRPGAPLVHEDKESNSTWTRRAPLRGPRQGARRVRLRRRRRRTSPTQMAHTCLEVSNCVAKWDKKDRLTIWTNTQAPHTQRQEVARILGIPEAQRARHQLVHGRRLRLQAGHGHEAAHRGRALAGSPGGRYASSTRAARSSPPARPATRTRCTSRPGPRRTAASWSRDLKVIGDAGAYHDKGPATINFSSMMFGTLYDVPNIRFDGRARLHQQGDGDGVPRLRQSRR